MMAVESVIRDRLFRMLGRREYSVFQARAKLSSEFSEEPETVESVIEEFEKKGWLSDNRFAKALVHDQVLRRQGPNKIRQKLLEKGVPAHQIEVALSDSSLGKDFRENLFFLAKKKAEQVRKKYPKISDFEYRGRVFQFLLGRGFDIESIRAIMDDGV
jgi:regulatory protein